MGSYRRVDLEYSQCVSDLSRLAPAPAVTCEVSSEDETRESRVGRLEVNECWLLQVYLGSVMVQYL